MAIVSNQTVKVKWVGANRKQLESHGHVYTKLYEELEIPIEHLSEKSHVKIKITCDWCNKEKSKRRTDIKLEGNHFCSSKCFGQWVSHTEEGKEITNKRKTSIKTNCKECEKEIYKIPSEFKGHGEHFCSRKCMGQHRIINENPNPKKEKVKISCLQCNADFEVHESKLNNKWIFCTRECYRKFRSENIRGDKIHNYQGLMMPCKNCGCERKVTKTLLDKNNNTVFCSRNCYYEYRMEHYLDSLRFKTANMIANGLIPTTNSSIHIKTREILNKLKLNFDEEIQFKYYVLDFYDHSSNLAIEVMGDFWHSSPLKYENYETLYESQKKKITKDKSKRTYLKKYHSMNILYLWEEDINTNPDLCEMLIKEYVKQNGILKEYNSFNYSLSDSRLMLNEEALAPFFMKTSMKH